MVNIRSELRRWVAEQGRVVGLEFLRVDGFLNHRIAPGFVDLAGQGICAAFAGRRITCVLTAEAAGNVIAYEVARRLGCYAIYAKKGQATTIAQPLQRTVCSPTKGNVVELTVSREYLGKGDEVLIVDDFLYQGTTSAALAELAQEAGANLVGFGFVIEKKFGQGRSILARFGVPIVSLVVISSLDPASGTIKFDWT